VKDIRKWDQDQSFEEFLLRLFEFSGLQIEDLGNRRYFLRPEGLKSDAFPALPHDGMTVTLNRQRALEHEQEAFLSLDHPMLRYGDGSAAPFAISASCFRAQCFT
jgi:ATP-dependent helicase HepA